MGQDCDRQAGVAVRGEADAGFVVEDVGDGDAQGLIGAVEDVLFLFILGSGGAVDALFISGTELFHLVIGQDHLVGGAAGSLEAEEPFDVRKDGLEAGLVLLVGGDIVGVVLGKGDLLVLQEGQVGVVVGAREADGQAAGFMVAGDDDEGICRDAPRRSRSQPGPRRRRPGCRGWWKRRRWRGRPSRSCRLRTS